MITNITNITTNPMHTYKQPAKEPKTQEKTFNFHSEITNAYIFEKNLYVSNNIAELTIYSLENGPTKIASLDEKIEHQGKLGQLTQKKPRGLNLSKARPISETTKISYEENTLEANPVEDSISLNGKNIDQRLRDTVYLSFSIDKNYAIIGTDSNKIKLIPINPDCK